MLYWYRRLQFPSQLDKLLFLTAGRTSRATEYCVCLCDNYPDVVVHSSVRWWMRANGNCDNGLPVQVTRGSAIVVAAKAVWKICAKTDINDGYVKTKSSVVHAPITIPAMASIAVEGHGKWGCCCCGQYCWLLSKCRDRKWQPQNITIDRLPI